MSERKKTLLDRGLALLSDPRVARLVQDERFMKTLMSAVSLPGKAQALARTQLVALAKAMDLATEDEVMDLRRTVRSLEDELSRLKSEAARARRDDGK
jgi:hypothetical protein